MRTIHFPEWPQVLAQAALPERLQHSFEITIRWYLSFCRRGRAEVTVQSARDFMAWAVQEKHPQEWQVEEWKEAVRWFFRTAGTQAATQAQCQTAAQSEGSVWLPEDRTGWPEWKVAFLTTVRRRRYSYRTEQSYLVWIERFARHLATEDLAAQGEAQIAEFLDSLAQNESLSASSQRQALNALVFLYREVFGKELGEEIAEILVLVIVSGLAAALPRCALGSSALVGPKPECFPIQAGPGCDALELGFGNRDRICPCRASTF